MEMTRYSTEIKTRKHVNRYGSLPFAKNLSKTCGKNYWILLQKNRIRRFQKAASKKVVHTIAEETEELIKKIAEKSCETKTSPWSKFEISWRNRYSTRKKTRNTN